MADNKRIKQLTQAEKRLIIAEQLRIAGQSSNRNLAAIIGCSPSTVGAVRRELAGKNEQIGQNTPDDVNLYVATKVKGRDRVIK